MPLANLFQAAKHTRSRAAILLTSCNLTQTVDDDAALESEGDGGHDDEGEERVDSEEIRAAHRLHQRLRKHSARGKEHVGEHRADKRHHAELWLQTDSSVIAPCDRNPKIERVLHTSAIDAIITPATIGIKVSSC